MAQWQNTNQIDNGVSQGFTCIICDDPFYIHLPNYTTKQTLFCETCIKNLKELVRREKTQDYGF